MMYGKNHQSQRVTKAFTLIVILVIFVATYTLTVVYGGSSAEILYQENFDARSDGDTIPDMWGHKWGNHRVGSYLGRDKVFVKSNINSGISSWMKTMYGKGVVYEWDAAPDNIFVNPVNWGFNYPSGEPYHQTANIGITWRGYDELEVYWWSLTHGSGSQSFQVTYTDDTWYRFKVVTYEGNTDFDLYIDNNFIAKIQLPDDVNDAIGGYFCFNAGLGNMHAVDNIEFYRPIPASIRILPKALNMKGRGRWVRAFISLPDGVNIDDIDPSLVRMAGIPADKVWVFRGRCVARFDRSEVIDYIRSTPEYDAGARFFSITLTVTGEVGGTMFCGRDTIKVINIK